MDNENTSPADFAPSACWEQLRLRASLLSRLRSFFDTRGFLEAETPLLSADTVVDRHLDPLSLKLTEHGPIRWLQTSPELAMKRLLAAGGEAIYQVTRAFRGGEQGALHNIEFTIAEWYRVGDSYQQGMQLLGELANELLDCGEAETISYAEAFNQHVGLDPHTADLDQLAAAAQQHDISIPTGYEQADRDSWLNLLLTESVEPHLGQQRPTILHDYPGTQAALAQLRTSENGPPVAERFELYIRGVELANGYHELLDPEELRRRNREANQQRLADGKQALPEESRLLAAMEHGLPPCTGVALGFDRLVMLAAGAKSIADVIAFPSDRA